MEAIPFEKIKTDKKYIVLTKTKPVIQYYIAKIPHIETNDGIGTFTLQIEKDSFLIMQYVENVFALSKLHKIILLLNRGQFLGEYPTRESNPI